ncbi:MAG TPA: apolipoprotein N-acyltransferase [Leptolyngbyaceae cyanobacterium]
MVDLKLLLRSRPSTSTNKAAQFSWKTALLLVGSGLVMSLAVPPMSLWPLAWFCLAPLWGVLSTYRTWKTSFLYGLFWGVGFYGSVLSWITALHPLTWMGVPWLGSIAIAAFAWSFVTLWGAATVGIWAVALQALTRFKGIRPVTKIVVGTTLWCVLEVLRNQTPLDWASLALTQSPNNLWILQLSQISGQVLIAALLVIFNGLLAEGCLVWVNRISPRASRPFFVSACVLALASHGFGAMLFSQVSGSQLIPLNIGLIQGNVPTRVKLTQEGIRQAWQGYLTGYQTLAAQGADAVLTPEGAIPAIWNPQTAQSTLLSQTVKSAGVPLWLGTFTTDPEHPGFSRVSQTLMEINAQGIATSRYNKVQLVPLGEYLPFASLVGQIIGRLSPLDSYLVPGSPHQQFVTSFGPAIVGICYESAYGRLFREQARLGGEFILTASNNDPYPRRMMVQHHALDVIRAIESDRWAVRATNTGLSGIVDPKGRTLWLAQPHTYTIHQATIYRRQTLTPYTRWGNWALLSLLGVSIFLLVQAVLLRPVESDFRD